MSKNKKHESAYRIANLMTVAGALICSASATMSQTAQLSGQGAEVHTKPMELQWVATEAVLPAAGEPQASGAVLAFGMLMMLIGFGIHAWHILNRQDGRPVPVRVRAQRVPKKTVKKTASKGRKTRRQAEVIWIERTIRF